MDSDTIARVKGTILSTAERIGYPIEELIVFGSRARNDYRPESDIDILIVSPAFQGLPTYKRSKLFYRHWDYDVLPDPEFICLTPAEFDEHKRTEPHIVQTAVEEGVSVV